MSNGIRTCIATTLFALLLVAPAMTQETPPDTSQRSDYPLPVFELMMDRSINSVFPLETVSDPWAYTPTGDALWDKYAQALLDQLPSIPFSMSSGAGVLPDVLLASWEEEFGADPRYWELRYWNALRQSGNGCYRDTTANDYLEHSVELGVSDAITEMLLYKHRQYELEEFWNNYSNSTPEEKAAFGAPDVPPGHSATPWFEDQEFVLAEYLVADCPDESWAWYASAMKRFNYGDWEAGLDDMHRGNEAVNNRVPMPFPASFVISRMANEQHCGNEAAAGIVAEHLYSWTMPNFIKMKDNMKNQEVRLAMGAPLSELEPWHYYSCRFGSMEGATVIQWLVAVVFRGMICKHLLVGTPESFTFAERDALWKLNGRGQQIKSMVRADLVYEQPELEGLAEAFRPVMAKHSIPLAPGELWPDGSTFENRENELTPEQISALYTDLSMTLYTWHYEMAEAEYGTVHRRAKEKFDKIATFNFETFSWPQ